jgi:putative peptidoglycan lipid II flippase
MTAFADQFEGAVTSLRNATTTWQLPYGIFAVAIGSVMLPSLAGIHARQDHKAGRILLTRSLRSALFLTIPPAALFLAMRQDVIRAIFQWNSSYTEQMVNVTGSVLKWYCLAIVTQTVIFIINQAFYARHQTRIALINGLATLALNSLLCLLLTRLIKMGVDGLSLAYMTTSCSSAVFLYLLYKRMFPGSSPKRFWPFWIRCFICTTAMLIVVLLLNVLPVGRGTKLLQLIWLAFRMLAGIAVYLAAAWLIKIPEALSAFRKIKAMGTKLASVLKKRSDGTGKTQESRIKQIWKKIAGRIVRNSHDDNDEDT